MNTDCLLFTDFYQLTMAFGYWKLGMAEQKAAFNLFFRKNPFGGKYAISCGLYEVIEFLKNYKLRPDEAQYLRNVTDKKGKPLFDSAFVDYLENLQFSCDVWGIREGELVFPLEPLLSVVGPLAQCQLIETALVNRMNFASLIATKASRVVLAAGDGQVMEFGMRRAQGPNGAVTASRAAYVGGCDFISNALAGMKFSIPVAGTVAHSWIMSFPDEIQAFEKIAEIMAENAVFLVDTYDTLQGVKNAIAIGKKLRQKHLDLLAIRLDSGDLYQLSRESRQLLNEAGFVQTKIIASGDLDEDLITKLKKQDAPIDIFGVGTRMTTAYDQPSLDTAYKLAAIENHDGLWHYKIKLSNTMNKTTNPGVQQVKRFYQDEHFIEDIIYDRRLGFVDAFPQNSNSQQDLLVEIFSQGKLVYAPMPMNQTRALCRKQVAQFIKDYPDQEYGISLDSQLTDIKRQLIEKIKKNE